MYISWMFDLLDHYFQIHCHAMPCQVGTECVLGHPKDHPRRDPAFAFNSTVTNVGSELHERAHSTGNLTPKSQNQLPDFSVPQTFVQLHGPAAESYNLGQNLERPTVSTISSSIT